MSYSPRNIRNICLLGHSGSGKTTLAESLLYVTGAIDRMGKTPDGNTTCDCDPEEVKRQISISLAVAPVEYKGCKINVLDTPGNFDFAGEVAQALCAADAAILVCSAKDGVSVGLEKAWKYCEERKLPRLIYISKTDEDNANYSATVQAIRAKYGNSIAPVSAPAPDGSCVIDLVVNKAYQMGKGSKRTEVPIPGDMADEAENLRAELMESAAGTDEELMEKFFDTMELNAEEIAKGVAIGVRDGSLVPVLCGSAVSGLGSAMLLDNVIALAPNPVEGRPLSAEDGEVAVDPNGAPAAFVFKTVADQYGKFSFVKVISGSLTSDMTLVNASSGANEKLGRLYTMRGKKSEEVKELVCGDIGAIGKMDRVKTGDTLC
ncbi:MAG: GTP-binding protein, partial [Oscillospiraceae bacterium]|nr:GTP-binding protein [Oscillospiraceae bacterium]